MRRIEIGWLKFIGILNRDLSQGARITINPKGEQ